MVNSDIIKRFTEVKQTRDRIQTEYIKRGSIIDQSRERYAGIMAELNKIGIGSLEELETKIKSIEVSINEQLLLAEQQTRMIEGKLLEIDNKKVGPPVTG